MKTKRSFLLIFTLCAALSLTACNGKQPANTEKPQDTQTESSAASSDDSSSELDDLYQQENQLFADHKDVWDKVFGMMNKSTADPSGNYADYLAGTVESNKDSFTEDELKILNDDIETIREIEEKITAIEKKMLHPTVTTRKIIPTMYRLSKIFPQRISMAILLTKACFPKMP